MRSTLIALLFVTLIGSSGTVATAMPKQNDTQPAESKSALNADTLAGLAFRSIGPAMMSGRIGDLAIDPDDHSHYYVAVASGGVWKTTNAGTTYTPIFDDQGSYSIGCITLDPNNPNVVWVGTGENNSQRSVSFGDGVYRSRDGGKNWEHLGLKESEHIGMITIDPRDSNVVYVAAQGPLWRSGGDRGLYKTTDGGQTWERILHISDDTGINEVHMDPRDPDTLYASAYQRRRRVWTLIHGGPESAIYKSTDAGATWRKLTKGLPEVDMGRIGLTISPANPDVVYAIAEAAGDAGGVFRSTDRGETWEKRSGHMCRSPQYYNELVPHPHDPDHLYVPDTFLHESRDGGKTFQMLPRQNRHVDDHALWINPENPDHMLVGSDGGIYETYDHGQHWDFKANLPITQFYRVAVDNSEPFYYVYGGTQDNSTLGGPSRTIDRVGIANEHWFITVGGDGFKTQVDPKDPNIVYSQSQYGGLVRHDRRSGEVLDIKPREAPDEEPLRWNWDSPLLISPHKHKRLYFAANKLFRSDEYGNSWTPISPDLTRQIDRNTLKVMGRIQPPDAVAKHHATSPYGTIVALAESPIVEGLLYVGTDDGLVQVSEDGGQTWREISTFPDVPERIYVAGITASMHDMDRVYVCFDNRKSGDFTPYILRSDDRGRTWQRVSGDLPHREVCFTLVEDHVKPELLFVGTEFGVYTTIDGGQRWIRLKGGLPTIKVPDLVIQRRENDLVLGTFGRSFYILDDYTPLRQISEPRLEDDALLFAVKDAWRYMPKARLGGRNGRGWQGAAYYAAPNPPFGAMFTYYLKDKFQTLEEQRKEAQKEAIEAGEPIDHPSIDELRNEADEREPEVVLTVRDNDGNVVRRIVGPREKGIHRVNWDLRYPSELPTDLSDTSDKPPWWSPPAGILAPPGTYSVELSVRHMGEQKPLAGPESFEVVSLGLATFQPEDRQAVLAFGKKVADLRRAVKGAIRVGGEVETRLAHLRAAHRDTPMANVALLDEIDQLDARLRKLLIALRGDPVRSRHHMPTATSISQRVDAAAWSNLHTTCPPTDTQRQNYRYAAALFAPVLSDLRELVEQDLASLEAKLESAGAPWTPGRLPTWHPE